MGKIIIPILKKRSQYDEPKKPRTSYSFLRAFRIHAIIAFCLVAMYLGVGALLSIFVSDENTPQHVLPAEKDQKTCRDFDTKREAQLVYSENPFKYATLDDDRDGFACESLP